MEEQMGLAASGAPQGQQAGMEEMVMKVAELLAQGVNPQDLLAQGVPQEIIDMAVQMLQQEQQVPQAPMVNNSVQGQGLAGQGIRG